MDIRERLLRAGIWREAVPDSLRPPPYAHEPPLDALVDGEWVHSSGARCFVVEHTYSLDHAHGSSPLSALCDVPPREWSPFVEAADDEQPFDPRRAVFLDTETTGLGRGAGTYAFLVGLGFFEGERFRLRQYFMPDYADEEALLDLVASDLAAHDGMVSFNGRSFDWPLMETRYILSRREPPGDGSRHLDLLHLSRRLWRRVLPSCALGALERSVLGVERRGDDVPSYLIPQLYHDYVRWGRARPMVSVLYHNAVDVLSMVTLAARIGGILHASYTLDDAPYRDYVALGRLYERVGRVQDALSAYQAAGDSDRESALACRHLSFLLKRMGRYKEAMEIWRGQLGGEDVYPYVELAKQLEHRLHNYAEARRVVEQAIVWVRTQDTQMNAFATQGLLADLKHRLARVERRLFREMSALKG
jgi:hypothetical protein